MKIGFAQINPTVGDLPGNCRKILDAYRTLVARGAVGSSAPRHLSFNGSIPAPGRLVRESAPEAAKIFLDDGVQAALLIPV